jgi:hypothetical protein
LHTDSVQRKVMPARASISQSSNSALLGSPIIDDVIAGKMDGTLLPFLRLEPAKNPAAVALSKLGASKGGQARAAALSGRRRKMIAKKAAQARWNTQI